MSDPETSFDDGIIADMRAHGGKVTTGPLAGPPILIMMSTGARIDVDDRVVEATASVAEGADRDRLWERHVASLPHFAAYPEQTGRVIPMVRLTPAA